MPAAVRASGRSRAVPEVVAWTVYCREGHTAEGRADHLWTFWKKALMPGTLAVARLLQAPITVEERSGFARWTTWPDFWLARTDPRRQSTSALTTRQDRRRLMAATAFWRSLRGAVKETSSGPWVEPGRAVSYGKRSPWGVSRWKHRGQATVARSTTSAHRHLAFRTQSSDARPKGASPT